MNLVATRKEAARARWVPRFGKQQGTGVLVHQGIDALVVTVRMQIESEHLRSTGFNPDFATIRPAAIAAPVQVAVSPAAMLATIRNAFGLNIKQLADVLQVTRVTVYEWLKLDAAAVLRENTRQRLVLVHMLAKAWMKLGAIPGSYLYEPLAGTSQTLEDLLKEEGITVQRLLKVHAALLSARSAQQRRKDHQVSQRSIISAGAKKVLADPATYGLELD